MRSRKPTASAAPSASPGPVGLFAQTFREASHSSHVQWALGEVDVASLRSVFVQQRRDAQGRGQIGGFGDYRGQARLKRHVGDGLSEGRQTGAVDRA